LAEIGARGAAAKLDSATGTAERRELERVASRPL